VDKRDLGNRRTRHDFHLVFIGISLAVKRALMLAAGLVDPPVNPGVVLFNLHANVWWGAALLMFGPY
jgi:hypothetical protein